MVRMLILGGIAALALAGCEEREADVEVGETPLANDPLVAPVRDLDEGVVAGEGGVVGAPEVEE